MSPGASSSEQDGTNRPPYFPQPHQFNSSSDLEDSPAPADAQSSTSQQTGAAGPSAAPRTPRLAYAAILRNRPASSSSPPRPTPELPHNRLPGSPRPAPSDAQQSTSQQPGAIGPLAAPRPVRLSYAAVLRDQPASSSPPPRSTPELPHSRFPASPEPVLRSSPPIAQGRAPRLVPMTRPSPLLNGTTRSPSLSNQSPRLLPPQGSTPNPAGLRPPGTPRPERLTSPSSFSSSDAAPFPPVPTSARGQTSWSGPPESPQLASRDSSYELPPLNSPPILTRATTNDNVLIPSARNDAAQGLSAPNPQETSQDAMDWRSEPGATADDTNRSGTGDTQQPTQTQQRQDGSEMCSRPPPPHPVSRSRSPRARNQTGFRSREDSAQNSGALRWGPSVQPTQGNIPPSNIPEPTSAVPTSQAHASSSNDSTVPSALPQPRPETIWRDELDSDPMEIYRSPHPSNDGSSASPSVPERTHGSSSENIPNDDSVTPQSSADDGLADPSFHASSVFEDLTQNTPLEHDTQPEEPPRDSYPSWPQSRPSRSPPHTNSYLLSEGQQTLSLPHEPLQAVSSIAQPQTDTGLKEDRGDLNVEPESPGSK